MDVLFNSGRKNRAHADHLRDARGSLVKCNCIAGWKKPGRISGSGEGPATAVRKFALPAASGHGSLYGVKKLLTLPASYSLCVLRDRKLLYLHLI